MNFVHLHVHTDYSLLDGAATVKALVGKARRLGMGAIAITDHGNMFGLAAFEEECVGNKDHPLKEGTEPVTPILGCEFYMTAGSRFDKNKVEGDDKRYHLVLLARNETGYRNLMKLSSLSFTEGFYYKPRIDMESLTKYKDGLICLSACVAGEIPSLILAGKREDAEKKAVEFRDLMGWDETGEPNFYIELQDHGLPVQKRSNPILIEIARKFDIPLVVTNDVHYLEKEDHIAHDVLLCIGTKKQRNDENRMRFDTAEFYFKSAEEMAQLFSSIPDAMENTVKIAARCNVRIPRPGPLLPEFKIPEGFKDANEYLRHLTFEGLKKRYGDPLPSHVVERADYELNTIIQMNFTGYFLIVQDFIGWAKDNGVPVGPGRGSGAGSVAAYALRITDIDPFKYELLFERFLNPERVSMPDFDIDFGDGRERVIEYVTAKYGKERVAQIITIGTLKAKAVVKDVARVLGVSIDDSNMLTKLIPDFFPNPKNKDDKIPATLDLAFKYVPELADLAKEPRFTELFEIAKKLEGKARQSGLHAAGVVIGQTDIVNYAPIFQDKSGGVAVQFDKNQIEPFGLVKMDFLGLATLDVLKNCEALIRRRGGEYANFDVSKAPEDDEATYKIFCEGNTLGLFQFESEGMRNTLVQAKPTSIADLTALNALFRPGPMEYIPQFIEGKKNPKKIHYPHPSLENLLKETYGVFVYQEQVMQAAQIVAGYSLGSADILRRAMGKKKASEMEKQKHTFMEGAEKNGISRETAKNIFETLEPFAGYGFNKSHAAAYSVLAYQTGYLKANFPVEFQAATLTNVMGNPDKLVGQMKETRKMNIEIVPPDVNNSIGTFSAADGKVFYGFLGIKGLGTGPASVVIEEREKNGKFLSVVDFIKRCDFKGGKKAIELLIEAGAFDSLDGRRGTLLGNFPALFEWAERERDALAEGQSGLFDDCSKDDFSDVFVMKEFPEPTQKERLEKEMALLGFYFSAHPLDEVKEAWEKLCRLDFSALDSAKEGEYTVIGILTNIKPHMMKNGKNMGFGSISDYNGEMELVFFNDVWDDIHDKLVKNNIVALKGKFDRKNGKISFLVSSMENLDNLKKKAEGAPAIQRTPPPPATQPATQTPAPRQESVTQTGANYAPPPTLPLSSVHIKLDGATLQTPDALYPLRTALQGGAKKCEVFLHVPLFEGGEKIVKTEGAPSFDSPVALLDKLKMFGAVSNAWWGEP